MIQGMSSYIHETCRQVGLGYFFSPENPNLKIPYKNFRSSSRWFGERNAARCYNYITKSVSSHMTHIGKIIYNVDMFNLNLLKIQVYFYIHVIPSKHGIKGYPV